MSLYDNSYDINEYDDFDQCSSYEIPSKLLPCCSYPANLVDLYHKLIEIDTGDNNHPLNEQTVC